MKKKTVQRSNTRTFWAPFVGLIVIYAGSALVLFVWYFVVFYIAAPYGASWYKVAYIQDLKQLNVQLLRDSFSYISITGQVSGIVASLLLVIFAFSGWVMLRIATKKLWYLPIIPILFIAAFSFHLTSSGNYSLLSIPFTQLFNDSPFKEIFITLCLLAALLGGWLQRHVSVHK
jgi:hypothetical protein